MLIESNRNKKEPIVGRNQAPYPGLLGGMGASRCELETPSVSDSIPESMGPSGCRAFKVIAGHAREAWPGLVFLPTLGVL